MIKIGLLRKSGRRLKQTLWLYTLSCSFSSFWTETVKNSWGSKGVPPHWKLELFLCCCWSAFSQDYVKTVHSFWVQIEVAHFFFIIPIMLKQMRIFSFGHDRLVWKNTINRITKNIKSIILDLLLRISKFWNHIPDGLSSKSSNICASG